MLEDRLCIQSNGEVNVRLAPEDMITCDYGNGACNGGLLGTTINFLSYEGIVSEECKPYASGVGSNGFCSFSCSDLSVPYKKYYCKKGSLKLPSTYEEIQQELMTNGPLQVGFMVYADFLTYSGGIYKVVDFTIKGGHAVKLIGWNHDGNG